MSNLKYLTVDQLEIEKQKCEKYISDLNSKLGGQKVRLEWINKYIFEKTPVEMTLEEIERVLGHKVIFKGGY